MAVLRHITARTTANQWKRTNRRRARISLLCGIAGIFSLVGAYGLMFLINSLSYKLPFRFSDSLAQIPMLGLFNAGAFLSVIAVGAAVVVWSRTRWETDEAIRTEALGGFILGVLPWVLVFIGAVTCLFSGNSW